MNLCRQQKTGKNQYPSVCDCLRKGYREWNSAQGKKKELNEQNTLCNMEQSPKYTVK